MLKNNFTTSALKKGDSAKFSYLTALGFDFGLKRIGIAVGQTLTRSANPVAILKAKNGIPNWEKIKELIETWWRVDVLVVGIPYNMDSSKQPLTHAAREFADKLKLKSGLLVHTVDERLTTIEAKRLWFEQKFQKNVKLPQQFDSYAAKVILEQWLQENIDRIDDG